LRSSGTIAAVAALFAIGGCSGQRQDADEPAANFPVNVTTATFPAAQRMSEHTHMVIVVRNAGHRAIPDLAVTICNVSCGTTRQANSAVGSAVFSEVKPQRNLADPSRPVWIVDQGPGKCVAVDRNTCLEGGGAGADVTAYDNTWALGRPLKPGGTATFDWSVTAVKPGSHVVSYQVAAGLNGLAHAVEGGAIPGGTFHVTISSQPQVSYVADGGQIVTRP
jgi:hypothetical protein